MIRAVAENFRQEVEVVRASVAAHPRYQELTRQMARAEGTRLVDLQGFFVAAGNDSLQLDWVHPNADGLTLVASSAAGVVRERLPVPSAGAHRVPRGN